MMFLSTHQRRCNYPVILSSQYNALVRESHFIRISAIFPQVEIIISNQDKEYRGDRTIIQLLKIVGMVLVLAFLWTGLKGTVACH